MNILNSRDFHKYNVSHSHRYHQLNIQVLLFQMTQLQMIVNHIRSMANHPDLVTGQIDIKKYYVLDLNICRMILLLDVIFSFECHLSLSIIKSSLPILKFKTYKKKKIIKIIFAICFQCILIAKIHKMMSVSENVNLDLNMRSKQMSK